ncbi:7TM receptor with intracellular metal dependent phosphohydrolase [Paenibacillus sp. 32O-W]|uniref:Cyclic-di-AMP phosphodiesterase PgpH n=1 Tax=Paenibacillus cisolokensis TaxID=1658519 RepID=A0ABQ4NBT8_9BACL|nr:MULTISPECIES: HDIG domain-containing metalloprotein [Paenibacillus]ALS27301.1 7TM receptor with intracellular metal dependent phosphohydrolase [Paenibacillus sp. 32O-W]GIQ65341.1 cyclic-di-AMP phosphodiesterase PgpH [Paenibacillus cisolokensis]
MDRKNEEKRGLSPAITAGWRQSAGVRLLLLLLFVLLFYFNLSPHLVPETYDIKLNTRAEKDIKAPGEWVDEKATQLAKDQAAEKVEQIYSIVALRNENLIAQIFDRMEQLNTDDQVTQQNKIDIYRTEIPRRYEEFVDNFVKNNRGNGTYNDSLLDEMARVVKAQAYTIPEETFYKMPRLTVEQIAEMRQVGVEVVRKLMSEQLREAETARTKVAELVNASALDDRTAREIVQELARFAIMPNKFADKEATDEARVLAKENTPQVVIKEGDIVVSKGQLITEEIYERLQGLNLLKEQKTYWPQVGVLLMSLLFVLAIYSFLHQTGGFSGAKPAYGNVQLLMLLTIYLVNIVTMQIVGMIQTDSVSYVGFLAPAAMGAMLITLLLDIHLAFVSSILFAIIGSVIFSLRQDQLFDFHYGFFIVVVSFSAIFAIHRASQRSTILKAGIIASLFGVISVIVLQLLGDTLDRTAMLYSATFAFASGLITAVLVIGLMPFFEVTFGILSALKLVELSNPNHPLLRKLLTETPGTYHHSVMVGNLSEAAAESIGANGLLCRVGSFYHDIGKTKRPNYFIENQTNIENPHDSIDPKLSKSIIIAHARDGVEMLKGYNIPKPIRDIAEQHHGTTSLKYFYHKALKQAEADGVEPDFTEEDFRYPGPKAQSKEAAIVGIADCVEAAVRSLRNPTMEQIDSMIRKIIKSRLDDNQFNECDLTLKELDRIAQTLKETVVGIFHSRIEYPDDVKQKERLA